MAENAPSLVNLVMHLCGEAVVRMEKFLEYFIGIAGKPITSLELSLREKTLLEFEVTVLIVK